MVLLSFRTFLICWYTGVVSLCFLRCISSYVISIRRSVRLAINNGDTTLFPLIAASKSNGCITENTLNLDMINNCIAAGKSRPLLFTELDLLFQYCPSIFSNQSAIIDHWPRPHRSEKVLRTFQFHSNRATESDVEFQLKIFRQTILGVEKYRISNPGNIAKKYVQFMRTCLRVPDAWGAVANSLTYAGLVFRDHVRDDDVVFVAVDEPGTVIPTIDVQSLWRQSAIRLLDLEFAGIVDEMESDKNSRSSTMDQKYFQPVALQEEARDDIRDFLLLVLRVAIRVVLSRDNVTCCCVRVSENASFPVEPSLETIAFVLALDFMEVEKTKSCADGFKYFCVSNR